MKQLFLIFAFVVVITQPINAQSLKDQNQTSNNDPLSQSEVLIIDHSQTLRVKFLVDVLDPETNQIVFEKGQIINLTNFDIYANNQ